MKKRYRICIDLELMLEAFTERFRLEENWRLTGSEAERAASYARERRLYEALLPHPKALEMLFRNTLLVKLEDGFMNEVPEIVRQLDIEERADIYLAPVLETLPLKDRKYYQEMVEESGETLNDVLPLGGIYNCFRTTVKAIVLEELQQER